MAAAGGRVLGDVVKHYVQTRQTHTSTISLRRALVAVRSVCSSREMSDDALAAMIAQLAAAEGHNVAFDVGEEPKAMLSAELDAAITDRSIDLRAFTSDI